MTMKKRSENAFVSTSFLGTSKIAKFSLFLFLEPSGFDGFTIRGNSSSSEKVGFLASSPDGNGNRPRDGSVSGENSMKPGSESIFLSAFDTAGLQNFPRLLWSYRGKCMASVSSANFERKFGQTIAIRSNIYFYLSTHIYVTLRALLLNLGHILSSSISPNAVGVFAAAAAIATGPEAEFPRGRLCCANPICMMILVLPCLYNNRRLGVRYVRVRVRVSLPSNEDMTPNCCTSRSHYWTGS